MLVFFSCYLHVYALYRALLKIQFPNIKLRIQYESQRWPYWRKACTSDQSSAKWENILGNLNTHNFFHNICLFKGYKENGEWQKSVQGQTTEMFKKVTIKFDGLKNANTFNIYAICSSSRLSTGDPRNQDIFLQKTAFSLVISRLALGSPGWFDVRHHSEKG